MDCYKGTHTQRIDQEPYKNPNRDAHQRAVIIVWF